MTTVVFPGIEKKSQHTRKAMIERFNSSVLLNEFPNGAKVMAIDPIRDGKFAPRYEGPYTVHSRSRSGAYILRDGTGEILKRQFAPSQLKIVLDDLEDGEVFDVERIVDHRQIENGEYEYFVKWKGYPSSANTWEPFDSFIETKCIDDYWKNLAKKSNAKDNKKRQSSDNDA
ncbi:hypothetical protein BGW42_008406 [Actinomortierella wolfii]|nr:hypothetical protein BGW42_008406 [Actinomortierella wolfii]